LTARHRAATAAVACAGALLLAAACGGPSPDSAAPPVSGAPATAAAPAVGTTPGSAPAPASAGGATAAGSTGATGATTPGTAPSSAARPATSPLVGGLTKVDPVAPATDRARPPAGAWTPIGTAVGGAPALEQATFPGHDSSNPVAVVWIDTSAVCLQLFPGARQPGGHWTTPFSIPASEQPGLVAAFNSGFLLRESQGGFELDGQVGVPLRDGSATVVIDADGTTSIGALGRDVHVTASTVAVRQNLSLLVDGGVVAASATDQDASLWGRTLGRSPFVWRSGLGIRADGTLVYAAGNAISARNLGNALVAAGAVRALELDMNPSWVTFNTYSYDAATGRTTGAKLLPGMTRSTDRYLTPDDRDFFAVLARPSTGTTAAA
jgi:hypothetical protein